MLDLTIAIPVRNEEKNLAACLVAIGTNLAQKIIVIDSGSTDSTRAIAQAHGVEVVDFKWNGQFPKKRNWFLQNHRPATKWILFLDADEYLTEPFKNELRSALSNTTVSGFWLNYTIYFMGKNLKGGYPLKKLALFQVGLGEYERIEEKEWSKLDMEIHEHPVLQGAVGQIRSRIHHQDFRGIAHYVVKHQEYATWEAARFIQAQSAADKSRWTLKQRIKYRLMESVLIGPVFFIGSFVFMGGFRDGSRGLSFAILKMSYFNLIYCKIRELRISNNIPAS